MTSTVLSSIVIAATEPAGPTRIDIGAVALTVAIVTFLVWVGYLVTTSRRKRKPEATPKNLQPWLSDEELENKRLTRVLSSAVVSAAALAIVLPVYYVLETERQEEAAEDFHALYIHEGEEWFQKFECASCHSTDGSGGAAEFIEPRSGLTVSWNAPPINDVLYRYSEEEVRFWIEFGRKGTPMPAQGLASGEGAMTVQEIDQVLAYLHEIQLPQLPTPEDPDAPSVLGKVEGAINQALARIENGTTVVARKVLEQQAVIDDIVGAAERLKAIVDFPEQVRELLTHDGICTEKSAALIDQSCDVPGHDSDRDGITDITETVLTSAYAPVIDKAVLVRSVTDIEGVLDIVQLQDPARFSGLYGLTLDPTNPFTMTDAAGHAVGDLESLDAFVRALDAAHLNLSVTTDRIDRFLPSAQRGLEFLEASAAAEAWEIDLDAVAAGMTREWATTDNDDAGAIDVDTARRAVGLFNAFCARCHTSGYSAGVAYEQLPGSGAWAPALTGGRAISQFPDIADHIDFIIRGSADMEEYGINGLGRGWMPGFGQMLSEEDIRLIALYERTL